MKHFVPSMAMNYCVILTFSHSLLTFTSHLTEDEVAILYIYMKIKSYAVADREKHSHTTSYSFL